MIRNCLLALMALAVTVSACAQVPPDVQDQAGGKAVPKVEPQKGDAAIQKHEEALKRLEQIGKAKAQPMPTPEELEDALDETRLNEILRKFWATVGSKRTSFSDEVQELLKNGSDIINRYKDTVPGDPVTSQPATSQPTPMAATPPVLVVENKPVAQAHPTPVVPDHPPADRPEKLSAFGNLPNRQIETAPDDQKLVAGKTEPFYQIKTAMRTGLRHVGQQMKTCGELMIEMSETPINIPASQIERLRGEISVLRQAVLSVCDSIEWFMINTMAEAQK